MNITSRIFEAYLKCPTKCWLRTAGERFSGNTYAEWVKTQDDFYRATETERLVAQLPNDEVAFSPPTDNIVAEKWRCAFSVMLQVPTEYGVLESVLHAMERVTSTNKGNLTEFIPIRFVFASKLDKDDKLLLGFDAFVLSESLGRETRIGKIIHGADSATLQVSVSTFTGDIRARIAKIAELLRSPAPPELILNRHCAKCEFRNRCRQKAKETDDLSLLSGMSEKERARHRSKGIFTVTQLSYTFRPRRTPKRAKNPAKPHHFALQALAIRENCVYIHGSPVLPDCESRVYLDIEGLPDSDFHYLIGALVVTNAGDFFHSFWADAISDQATIFLQFAEVISQLPDYRVFHFGDYDAAAMKRASTGLPKSTQDQFAAILAKSVNILSLVYPHVYFPTYSNSLKEIVKQLDHNFIGQEATGLDSIVWRMEWERARDSRVRTRLLEYNRDDCIALQTLTEFIIRRTSQGFGQHEDGITLKNTQEMKLLRPHWQLFAPKPYALSDLQNVSKSAYFDYQREKIFIRTHPQFKAINQRVLKNRCLPGKPNKTILFEAQICPDCQSKKLDRGSESGHIVLDLKYSKHGVKKYITRFVSWRYSCQKCGKRFRSEERVPNPQRYGHGLASWCVYQNNVLGVNMSKVRKSLGDVFGLHLDQSMLDRTKERIAAFYVPLYSDILNSILAAPVLHIDETTVRLRKQQGYVWVLTTLDRVYYLYRPTRETGFLREMLAPFRGVLVSDFYTGYDYLPCEQQKCLVHLVRDIDDDLLRSPLDQELKRLAEAFGTLLRSIVSTIDRFGLRSRHLKKHKREVNRFMEDEVAKELTSDLATKYAKRFKKYGSKMFTFLDHNGVPWNNNNAEHAIKRFVKYRRDNDGRYSEKTVKEYLILASVFETCEFNNVNVLKFLLAKERTFDSLTRARHGRIKLAPICG